MKAKRSLLNLIGGVVLTGAASVPFSGCNSCEMYPQEYWDTVQQQLEESTRGETEEHRIDQGILKLVNGLAGSLRPEYAGFKSSLFGLEKSKYKLGLIELSDIDRKYVSKFDKYVTEKMLPFAFKTKAIGQHYELIERFMLSKVVSELKFEQGSGLIDSGTARRLGEIYGIDVLASGVTTVSRNSIDLNVRMVETETGRIIASEYVKIPRNSVVDEWLREKTEIRYKREGKDWE